MIAVLIPVRNSANTIQRALNSVNRQNCACKVFVVDNDSTDNLKSQIKGYNVEYIKCDELGVAPALNSGIFQIISDSTINRIARLDADDEWIPGKLKKQLDYMDKLCLDICGTQMQFSGSRTFVSSYPIGHNEFFNFLINGNNPIGHPSVVYDKKIFYYTGGYDENYKGAEDFDLWTRCYARFKFGNHQDVLVNYTLDSKDRSIGDTNAALSALKFRNQYAIRFSNN